MKVALFFFATVAAAAATEDHYTTKYDGIDIDVILSNRRLVLIYNRCLLDLGKCNEEGQVLKDVIPDALLTACRKCNEVQKQSVGKVARFLIKNHRNDWDALVQKYDPTGVHRKNYQQYYDQVLN